MKEIWHALPKLPFSLGALIAGVICLLVTLLDELHVGSIDLAIDKPQRPIGFVAASALILVATVFEWRAHSSQPLDELPADKYSDGLLSLITSNQQLKESLLETVGLAEKELAICGSRSADGDYLAAIEQALFQKPTLVHHRVLIGPPRNQVLKDHLLRIINRDALPSGDRRTFFGIAPLGAEPEFFVCASESQAVIVLPSVNGLQRYDTGLLITDSAITERYVAYVRALNGTSRKLTSAEDIRSLVVQNHV